MDRQLPAPHRSAQDDDAPPSASSSRGPRDSRPLVKRLVAGIVVGAVVMLGVALLDTTTGATVPVLGQLAALPAGPSEPEVIESPPPPSEPGTCLNWAREDAADTAAVDCSQPHLFEQAGTVVLADQIELPSNDIWRQLVNERCGPVVLSYLGNVLDPDGRFRVGALSPSASRWAAGDRELRCGLQTASRSGALYPITGRVAEQDQANVYESGTCLAIDGRTIGDPVDCAGQHAVEVIGIVDLSTEFPEGFPQVADQDTFLLATCNQLATTYAGDLAGVTAQGITVYWNNLSEASWAAGTRRVNCNFGALLPDQSGFAPLSGPVLGGAVVGTEAAPPAATSPVAGVPAPPTTVVVAPPVPDGPVGGDPTAPVDGGTPPTEGEVPPTGGEVPPPSDPGVPPPAGGQDPAAPPSSGAVVPVP